MNDKKNLRSLVILAALALAAASHAQRANPEDEARAAAARAATNRMNAISEEAGGLAGQAREALRKRDFRLTARLAERSILLTDGIGDPNYRAHEILAESYLIQKRYGAVLGEVAEFKNRVGGRFAMTEALALLGQGRRDEAKAVVLREVGPPGAPRPIREENEIWEVPLDRDGSDAAIAATALLVRGSSDFTPEDLDDLLEAARLKPGNGATHLRLATWYGKKDWDKCLAELIKARDLGDPRTRKEANDRIPNVMGVIASRKANGGG